MPRLSTADPEHGVDPPRSTAHGRGRWARAWRQRGLLLRVLLLLGVARLALLVIPFRRLARALGPADVESPLEVCSEALAEADRLAWAIRVVSRRTPWASTCFPQALTGLVLMRRRGIASTLYLGAAIRPDRAGMEAHAWLRCGVLFVTGGPGHLHYGVVARFGGVPRRRGVSQPSRMDRAR